MYVVAWQCVSYSQQYLLVLCSLQLYYRHSSRPVPVRFSMFTHRADAHTTRRTPGDGLIATKNEHAGAITSQVGRSTHNHVVLFCDGDEAYSHASFNFIKYIAIKSNAFSPMQHTSVRNACVRLPNTLKACTRYQIFVTQDSLFTRQIFAVRKH